MFNIADMFLALFNIAEMFLIIKQTSLKLDSGILLDFTKRKL